MHHRRIQPGCPVGEPHITRARLQRVVEQSRDLRQQRRFGRRGDPDAQSAEDVERSGINCRAALRRDVTGLAGDQALVDRRSSFDHRAVDRAALAGPQQHHVAGTDRRNRHLRNLVGPDELGGGLRLERGEVSRHRPGAPAHALVEIAPHQQKCQQHDRRIEIGVLGVVDGFDHRHAQRKHHADTDRNIHIDVARAQRAKRRPEERLARIGRGRQRDQRGQPMEKVALFRNHVADIAGPHRNGKHHHVHGGECRDAETAQQKAGLLGFRGLRIGGFERIGLVSELGQPIDEADGIERALLPFQRHAAVGQIDARQRDVGYRRKAPLDLRHASGATDAFDGEIDMGES